MPEDINVMRNADAHEVGDDVTVGDLIGYVETHGQKGIGTIDEMLERVIRDRDRANEIKRSRRKA